MSFGKLPAPVHRTICPVISRWVSSEYVLICLVVVSVFCRSEPEGSKRMKTELLVQMDGLARSDDLVFLLAASNLPW